MKTYLVEIYSLTGTESLLIMEKVSFWKTRKYLLWYESTFIVFAVAWNKSFLNILQGGFTDDFKVCTSGSAVAMNKKIDRKYIKKTNYIYPVGIRMITT